MNRRIANFNQRQLIRAIVAGVACVIATVFTYWFFTYVTAAIAGQITGTRSMFLARSVGLAFVALVYFAGWRAARNGAAESEFSESSFFVPFDYSNMAGYYVNQIAGPAYLLTQAFLSAPAQLLKCQALLRSRFESTPQTEERLQGMLDRLLTKKTWHPVSTYEEDFTALRRLVSMELVDFSARKGVVQASNSIREEYAHEEYAHGS